MTGQLGASAGNAALVAEWSTGKVVRVSLDKKDGAYESNTSTFLTGVKKPGAVLLAPDGSVLVGDWATGRIYRVVR